MSGGFRWSETGSDGKRLYKKIIATLEQFPDEMLLGAQSLG